MILSSGQAKASKHVIFMAPPGGAVLRCIFFRNTHTAALTFNLYSKSKAGSSVGLGVAKDMSIDAAEAFAHYLYDIELGEGDQVEMDASTADKVDWNLFGRLGSAPLGVGALVAPGYREPRT